MPELSWDSYVSEQLQWAESFRKAAKRKSGAEARALLEKSKAIFAETKHLIETKNANRRHQLRWQPKTRRMDAQVSHPLHRRALA